MTESGEAPRLARQIDGASPNPETAAHVPSTRNPSRLRRQNAAVPVLLLLALPGALMSCLILLAIGRIVQSWIPYAPHILVGLFLASYGLLFWPPTEAFLVRTMLRWRRPIQEERVRIESAWDSVTRSAGVEGSGFTFWVVGHQLTSGGSVGAHSIGITSADLKDLSPDELKGVLAHELCYHYQAAAAFRLLSDWLSTPAWIYWNAWFRSLRKSIRVLGFAVKQAFALELWNTLFACGEVTLRLIVLVALAAPIFMLLPWSLLLLAIPLLRPLLFRFLERRADSTAADLGYGPFLASALKKTLDEGGASPPSILEKLLSIQNEPVARILALERHAARA